MNISRIVTNTLFVVLLVLGVGVGISRVRAQESVRVFTPQELSQFDGKNGHPAYFAYKGKVYDVTGDPQWKDGEHYGNLAGKDLTGMMEGAPHGEEVLTGLKVMGTFSAVAIGDATPLPTATPTPVLAAKTTTQTNVSQEKQWYEQRFRFAGISLLGWTGILLGIVFLFNFATCFALPWSQFPLPWKGSRPGPDPLDIAPEHMRWATTHKYFAWATVILGIVHGILGFMQMLGYTV